MTPSDTARICSMPIDRGRTLDLRDDRCRRPGFVERAPSLEDVRFVLHEAERDEVDTERGSKRQIRSIFGGQRRCRERHARRVDALVLAEEAAVDDNRIHAARVHTDDLQLDPSIVKQETIARFDRARQAVKRGEDEAGTAFSSSCLDAKPIALGERKWRPGCKPPRADLRAAKILQDRDNPLCAAGGLADQDGDARVLLVRAVREVEPKQIDAGRDESLDPLFGRACRAERRDDLRVTRHSGFSLTIAAVVSKSAPVQDSVRCTIAP
jgi:hypothetical protein